ncbi:MAG: malonyl-CoA decarboxylase, partial [Alphaproteobacteria bacterium]
LATEFGGDDETTRQSAQALLAADTDAKRQAARRALRQSLEPPRVRLLRQFNALPEGVKFLVDMRAEIMALAKRDKAFAALDDELLDLLRSWFDVGFLELRRITWNAPATLLEKLIAYEAVHEIQSWDDLKNRLASDRRCFAFFHPRMPDEPLIFVEVALVKGLAGNIQTLLDPAVPVLNPAKADTAIFYSISNAQKGLAGISFGNFLIKRVVDVLSGEFRNLKTFATLSPIPGFCDWLRKKPGDELLRAAERKALPKRKDDDQHPLSLIKNPEWHKNEFLAAALKTPFERLCAQYLLNEKRADGYALDPVAHFHLTNGARIERINWLADVSPNGLAQAAGLMVNYLYISDEIDKNHETYSGEKVALGSSAVRALAKSQR